MRSGFSQQLSLYSVPIEKVSIRIKKNRANHISDLLLAMQHLYRHPILSVKVEALLREGLDTKKGSGKGTPGMSLWEIFVLSQLRLCLNISYDEVEDLANNHFTVRGILGLNVSDGTPDTTEFSKSTIYDNLILLKEETLHQINDLVLELGHEVFKHNKKKDQALSLKTDSFVVEADVHFPTDYRSLYESGRKCLELIASLNKTLNLSGWRQWKDIRKKLKSAYRSFGKVSSSGGKNKKVREKQACHALLLRGDLLTEKVSVFIDQVCPMLSEKGFAQLVELEWFHQMLDKHIDLLERRVIQEQTIAHQDKVFSIFQPFVEWINKGKRNVEIGKKVFVTTDQYHLIIDYQTGDHLQDDAAILPIMDRILDRYQAKSWSTDKGFSSKENKTIIECCYPDLQLIMPKKGKKNAAEQLAEREPLFVKLNNKHSAIESNINELEHRGLNRCPDRSPIAFQKYIGLSVVSYNLHKIGRKLSQQIVTAREKESKKLSQAA